MRTPNRARQTAVHAPPVAPRDYVACWEDKDALGRVGSHTLQNVKHELWPWLKQKGFADDGDDNELLRFLDEFPVAAPRICAQGFDSAASGHPPKRPTSVPRSLTRSAAISMPCSLARMNRR